MNMGNTSDWWISEHCPHGSWLVSSILGTVVESLILIKRLYTGCHFEWIQSWSWDLIFCIDLDQQRNHLGCCRLSLINMLSSWFWVPFLLNWNSRSWCIFKEVLRAPVNGMCVLVHVFIPCLGDVVYDIPNTIALIYANIPRKSR